MKLCDSFFLTYIKKKFEMKKSVLMLIYFLLCYYYLVIVSAYVIITDLFCVLFVYCIVLYLTNASVRCTFLLLVYSVYV